MAKKNPNLTAIVRRVNGMLRDLCEKMVLVLFVIRGGSRAAATSKVELFVMIVNGWKPLAIITKELNLGCCSSPRSASGNDVITTNYLWKMVFTCRT